MRYFRIYADKRNQQPRFLDLYSRIRPGSDNRQIYDALGKQSHFPVELKAEIPFMDIIDHPCFMVSKEFANVIRLYSPQMQFKYATLFDANHGRTSLFQIPILPEIDCLHEKSNQTMILKRNKIEDAPIFLMGGVTGQYVIANFDFVESAYRRESIGMRIQEYMVE